MVDENGLEFVVIIKTQKGFHTVRSMEQIIGMRVEDAWVSPNAPDYIYEKVAMRLYPLGVKVKDLT